VQLSTFKLLSRGATAIREADSGLPARRAKRSNRQPGGLTIVAAFRLSKTLLPILFAAAACAGNAQPPSQAIACAQDAKICPGGSSVARSGPHCEMAACPAPRADGETKPGAGSGRPKAPGAKPP
jgi:hypothetical protein